VKTVTCFGALHLDVKARLTGTLLRGTSNPVTTTRAIGGVATNVARSLARLGVPVHLVSIVGPDSAPLLDRISIEGVDVTHVRVTEGASTASYTAVLAADGCLEAGIADMDIYGAMDADWGHAAPTVGDLWFAEANIPGPGLQALATAAVGRPFFVDPVSVEKSQRVAGVIDRVACIFPDAGEAEALTGESDPEAGAANLIAQRAGGAVVTTGRDGVVVADGESVTIHPAIAPNSIVDVTGAGDALVAGYLAALALGGDDPVAWGLAAASLAVETIETVPGDLNLAGLLARL